MPGIRLERIWRRPTSCGPSAVRLRRQGSWPARSSERCGESRIADIGRPGRGDGVGAPPLLGVTMNIPVTGTHMIVLPGGGYAEHAPHEAELVAGWLGEIGVQASVFRYPLNVRHPVPLWDWTVSRAPVSRNDRQCADVAR